MPFLATPGSSPALSSAEAIARLPDAGWRTLGPCFLAETLPENALNELSGCTKIGSVIFSLPTQQCTAKLLAEWIHAHPHGEDTSAAKGKLTFSLTWHGASPLGRRLPIELKHALKATGRSVRWFENDGNVSPAAIAKLDLIHEGYDFTIIEEGTTCWVAVTDAVQDADLWTKFDMERPRRNAKNGMTPPKLASIMTHLAGHPKSLLDPFCGSGTILATAAMAGVSHVYGSDISANIIADAKQNLAWAGAESLVPASADIDLTVADACKPLPLEANSIDAIVTEGYLGTPLQGNEEQGELEREAQGVREIWEAALPHLYHVLKKEGVVIASWPSYRTPFGQARVDIPPLRLRDLGFLLEPFVLVNGTHKQDLIYVRQGQSIARRIVKLRKS